MGPNPDTEKHNQRIKINNMMNCSKLQGSQSRNKTSRWPTWKSCSVESF